MHWPPRALCRSLVGLTLLATADGAAAQSADQAPVPTPPQLNLDSRTWWPAAGAPPPRPEAPVLTITPALRCSGCGGDEEARWTAPRHPNAPWTVSGTVALTARGGTFSASVVGQRGAQFPLFMQGPIDAAGRMPPSTAGMADTQTAWNAVLRAERPLKRWPGGQTIALFAEGFVPLGRSGAAPPRAGMPTVSGAALWVGLRIRW